MNGDRVQVFLSSAMNDELATERAVLRERFSSSAFLSSWFELYLFEDHAGPMPARAAYVQEVEHSPIVIVLLAETLRPGVVEEFDAATRGSAIFCYLRSGAKGEKDLDRFIKDRVQPPVQYSTFTSPSDLASRVEKDIIRWVVQLVDGTREPAPGAPTSAAQIAPLGSLTAQRFCRIALDEIAATTEHTREVPVDLSAHSLWGTVRPEGLSGLSFDHQAEIQKYDPQIDRLELNGAVFPALNAFADRGLSYRVRVLLLHPDSDQAKRVDLSQRSSSDTMEEERFARTDIYLTIYVLRRLSRQHPELGLSTVRVLSQGDSMAFSMTRIGGHALVAPYPNDFLLEAAASYSVSGVPGDLAPFGKRLAEFEEAWGRTEAPGAGHEIDLGTLPGEFPDIQRRVDEIIKREPPVPVPDPNPFGTRTKLLTLYGEQVQAIWDGKDPYPVALEVNPANDCDQGCHWCISENVHRSGSSINFDRPGFAAFMEDFHRLGGKAVGWSGGGEPTNHPNLAKGMRIVNKVGLKQGLITHGAFRPDLISPIAECCSWVRVSVDTNSPDDYARKRGRTQTAGLQAFHRVGENVKSLVAAGAHVGLNMNVAQWNLTHVEGMYDWSVALGAKYLQVRPTLLTPFPHVRGEDLLSSDDTTILLRTLKTLERRAKGSRTRLIVSYDKFSDFAKSNHGRGYKGCEAHRLFVVLKANGDLAVCMYQMTDDRFIFGNIFEDSLESIWQSDQRKEARRFCSRDLNHVVHQCQVCCKGHEINKVLEHQYGGVRTGEGTGEGQSSPFI